MPAHFARPLQDQSPVGELEVRAERSVNEERTSPASKALQRPVQPESLLKQM